MTKRDVIYGQPIKQCLSQRKFSSGSSKYFWAGKWLRKNKSVCLNIFLFQDMSISFSLKICLSHSLSKYVSLILSQNMSLSFSLKICLSHSISRFISRDKIWETNCERGIFWEKYLYQEIEPRHLLRMRWYETILTPYAETEMGWDNLSLIFRDWDEMR